MTWPASCCDRCSATRNEVPFLRPADGAISIAMDRRASDGAVVSTSFDVHMPQRGTGVFHLALASLPEDVRLSNVVDRTGIVSRTVAEGIVPVRRRLAFRELSIVGVGRLGNEVPFLRPADGAISIAMDRRVSDGAVVSTSFDVHIPQRGAGVFHLALASLPVSTIVSLKLRVGDQSPLR